MRSLGGSLHAPNQTLRCMNGLEGATMLIVAALQHLFFCLVLRYRSVARVQDFSTGRVAPQRPIGKNARAHNHINTLGSNPAPHNPQTAWLENCLPIYMPLRINVRLEKHSSQNSAIMNVHGSFSVRNMYMYSIHSSLLYFGMTTVIQIPFDKSSACVTTSPPYSPSKHQRR